MLKIIHIIALLLICCFYSIIPLMAEKIEISGSYYYGADTSENEACMRAKEKAERNALTKVLGENLTSEGVMHCKETEDEEACKHYSSIWTIVSGVIIDMEEIDRIVSFDGEIQSDFCEIKILADVVAADGVRDPSFDLKISLNEKFFRDKEHLEITISPNKPMYISIFNWSPHKEEKVEKIFPNSYEKNNFLESITKIPGTQDYIFRLNSPENKNEPIKEFIMVVATKKAVPFMKNYNLKNLKERINEIDMGDRREITTSYILAK